MSIHPVLILNPWLVGGLLEIHCRTYLPKTLYVMSGGYSKDHLPCQESCARDGGHQHCVVCEKEKTTPCESWGSLKKRYTPWKSSTILEDDLTPY